MTSAQYNALTAPLRRRRGAVQALRKTNQALTLLSYAAYPTLLLIVGWDAFIGRDARLASLFWRELLVPAFSFVLVSIVRSWISAPRPYEKLDIEPLIKKNTRGHSFPSRHVFSSFIIAMGWLAFCELVGIVLLIASSLLAVMRVLGGVHWPRDVVAGAALGVAAGLLILS